jgi:preprotein translocase subunit SecD
MLQIPLWQRVLIWGVVALGLVLALPNAFYTRVETHNDARTAVAAGQAPEALEAELALWPSFLPSGLVNLGLDLRGGAHLLAEVQLQDVYAERMDALWPDVRDALAARRDVLGSMRRTSCGCGSARPRRCRRRSSWCGHWRRRSPP